MRKFIISILFLTIFTANSIAEEYYEVRHVPTPQRSEYTLDQRFSNVDASSYLGVMTRFGYSFSDNGYFSYGVSLYYTFNSVIGVTAGFDGYAGKIYVYDNNNEIIEYNGPYKSLPLWNIRSGITLGKYISFGVIYGRCRICRTDYVVVHRYSDKLTTELGSSGSFWGGFGTVIAPISTHLALDFDLSYTTHTSFTISAGLIVRFKVK